MAISGRRGRRGGDGIGVGVGVGVTMTAYVAAAFFVVVALLAVGGSSQMSEQEWESAYLAIPSAQSCYEHLQQYTSVPHSAGTPEDYDLAVYTRDTIRSYGLEAEIQSVDTLLTFPLQRSLEIISPPTQRFQASLREDVEPLDPSSGDPRVLPTFNGFSPSGIATGEVVYVNYGRIEDFQALQAAGVPLKGKVALARYGAIFRGTKAMLAQQFGMIGLIIYSDPADDGYVQGPVFPNGPWRSNSSVQRGSVQFLSICAGDPRNVECAIDPKTYNYTQVLPAIPVQPISYSDATPILMGLNGTLPNSSWQGGLKFTYHTGPGPVVVRLILNIKFNVTPIWNVVATIPGYDPDEGSDNVLIGNHRDAWTFGAVDPNSGSASLLEVARGFGELLKQGWKPRRSITLCSWDGEEYGLLGSTAFALDNKKTLQANAVAYLNVDVGVQGAPFTLGVDATPTLAQVIRSAAKNVTDPASGKPLDTVWNNYVGVLGSGSDYTAFIDNVGVPSASLGFNGAYGVYHSVYDSFYWMTNFGDTTFEYHKAVAQLWGLTAMRLADSRILPFNYTHYSEALNEYLLKTEALAKTYNVSSSNWKELQLAISAFSSAASSVAAEIAAAQANTSLPVTDLNNRLKQTERQFLSRTGLPKRPFYKHVIQAPGLYQGYNADVFPGLAQAIRDQNELAADLQQRQIGLLIAAAATFLCDGCV